MGLNIQAYNIAEKKFICNISIRRADKLADQMITLMGVTKSTHRRIYTQAELKQMRKISVNIITDPDQRREVKAFLTTCIDVATNTDIDIWFA